MRHVPTLRHYLNLIALAVKTGFDQVKREKKKLFIYAYLTDMVDIILSDLQVRYPEYKILRYVSGDPFANVDEAEICVTTLGSAGTALDITDLTNTLLTTNVSSEKANLQFLGRLRPLKDGHPVHMQYLVAANIAPSLKYHHEKLELFRPCVRSHKIQIVPGAI